MNKRLCAALATATLGTMTLAGCAGDDSGSPATVTVTQGAGGTATADAGAAASAAAPAAAGADASAPTTVAPAAERTVEVGEEKEVSEDGNKFTLTVHRIVVHDYYVEAEVTLVNNGTNDLGAWWGSPTSGPQLYDDKGVGYGYVPDAANSNTTLYLKSGEGLDGVLVFAGRMDPEAREVKLDFTENTSPGWSQVTFDIPLGGGR